MLRGAAAPGPARMRLMSVTPGPKLSPPFPAPLHAAGVCLLPCITPQDQSKVLMSSFSTPKQGLCHVDPLLCGPHFFFRGV